MINRHQPAAVGEPNRPVSDQFADVEERAEC